MDIQKNLNKFGICEPYLQDIKLLPLYKQYIQSDSYKNIQREYNKYKLEKWDYISFFYEPDTYMGACTWTFFIVMVCYGLSADLKKTPGLVWSV